MAEKENAGEISVAYLAYLLAYRWNEAVEITIWSHDSDCKCCIDEMGIRRLNQQRVMLGEKIFFSYKNVDVLLKELFDQRIISDEKLDELIHKIRSRRRMTYVCRKIDGSTELRREEIDNRRFRELIDDDSLEIIW